MTYGRSPASPTVVMAVWSDFAAQSSWVPGLVASRVVARDAPNVIRVFYEYEVAGPNERYTITIRVSREGEGWQARWTLVAARYARRLEGSLRVLPRGEGSLVSYSSLVDPGTLGATFGTPESVAQSLVATTEALATRTERLSASDPRAVAALVDALTALVGTNR